MIFRNKVNENYEKYDDLEFSQSNEFLSMKIAKARHGHGIMGYYLGQNYGELETMNE